MKHKRTEVEYVELPPYLWTRPEKAARAARNFLIMLGIVGLGLAGALALCLRYSAWLRELGGK